MTQGVVAVSILLFAILLMYLGYWFPKMRVFLLSIGFYCLMSGIFASYSNWLPQTRGEVPPIEKGVSSADIEKMPTEKLAEMGSKIIFGDQGVGQGHIGKGQCPLCHGFIKGELSERAPNLFGIPKRAAERINDPIYKTQKTIQAESFPGAGRATTAEEYIAESHSCPNCFIVPGFGTKGTNDTESPMPTIHKAPILLSIEEEIAVDTWLFFREGEAPPPAAEIRKAYEKFIAEKDRPKAEQAVATAAPAGPPVALATDTPEQIITKMGCFACHKIPTVALARFGAVGPLLIEGTNAAKRIASPEYQKRVKAGKAHAKTPKEYVMESIVNPNAFIVPGFENKSNPEISPMIQDFATKFTYGALEKMADFLLSLDEKAAIKDGLLQPGQKTEIDVDTPKQAGLLPVPGTNKLASAR